MVELNVARVGVLSRRCRDAIAHVEISITRSRRSAHIIVHDVSASACRCDRILVISSHFCCVHKRTFATSAPRNTSSATSASRCHVCRFFATLAAPAAQGCAAEGASLRAGNALVGNVFCSLHHQLPQCCWLSGHKRADIRYT